MDVIAIFRFQLITLAFLDLGFMLSVFGGTSRTKQEEACVVMMGSSTVV
jgi:hypothetical protein